MLILRRYSDADAAAVWRLHVDALRRVDAYAGDGPWDDDLRRIRATYLDNRGEFVVGLVNGQIVAMGALRRRDARTAEIKRMRVDACHQRRGYGRRVLRHLERRAQQLGYRRLVLDTMDHQSAACRLYAGAGYRETGRRYDHTGTELVFFEKRLAPEVPVADGLGA